MVILAVPAAVLALPGLVIAGGQAEARANPVYWLILIPVAWLAGDLSGFGARQVRLMMPAIIVAPLLAIGCLTMAYARGDTITLWIVATAMSIITALACRLYYNKGLLRCEGPDRWR